MKLISLKLHFLLRPKVCSKGWQSSYHVTMLPDLTVTLHIYFKFAVLRSCAYFGFLRAFFTFWGRIQLQASALDLNCIFFIAINLKSFIMGIKNEKLVCPISYNIHRIFFTIFVKCSVQCTVGWSVEIFFDQTEQGN